MDAKGITQIILNGLNSYYDFGSEYAPMSLPLYLTERNKTALTDN